MDDLEEESLLQRLKLDNSEWLGSRPYDRGLLDNDNPEPGNGLLYVVAEQGWFHIMDNHEYNLWNNVVFRNEIKKLGYRYKVFTACIGDVDRAFEYTYYNGGEKLREYVVEDPGCSTIHRVVTVNHGHLLPDEEQITQECSDELELILKLAESIGAPVQHEHCMVNLYLNHKVGNLPQASSS